MNYHDLRSFIKQLAQTGKLLTISSPVSPVLEMTEISRRMLHRSGPALLFTQPLHNNRQWDIPVLTNLFGTQERIAMAMGADSADALREIGQLLAYLKEPEPPRSIKEIWEKWPVFKQVLSMSPKTFSSAPCQKNILADDEVDLNLLPVQHCWPEDAAPLITWGLTITRGPHKKRQNLGIYRMQLLGKNKLIMRWLAHRGGALDFMEFQQTHPGERFPVSVALGCDPATILAAVTPIPDTLSEYQFAGLLRGSKTELAHCLTNDLQVPAQAEIILEGYIDTEEKALEGPYGDHTGYYNEQEWFNVFTVTRMTMRNDPIYLSTYTGKPPDEPAMLGLALNEVFVPILQKQFPEITDFYLPTEGCSYRMAIISMRKQFPGHAKRVMMGCWSFLRQFMYTKFIVVVDDDINIRDWKEVIWAITTRMDPVRDTTLIDHTPIDYLDFASPVSGLGGKMGLDATNKWPAETTRQWGKPITMDAAIIARVDELWDTLGLAAELPERQSLIKEGHIQSDRHGSETA